MYTALQSIFKQTNDQHVYKLFLNRWSMKLLTSCSIEKSSCIIDKKVRYDMLPDIHVHVLSLHCRVHKCNRNSLLAANSS